MLGQVGDRTGDGQHIAINRIGTEISDFAAVIETMEGLPVGEVEPLIKFKQAEWPATPGWRIMIVMQVAVGMREGEPAAAVDHDVVVQVMVARTGATTAAAGWGDEAVRLTLAQQRANAGTADQDVVMQVQAVGVLGIDAVAAVTVEGRVGDFADIADHIVIDFAWRVGGFDKDTASSTFTVVDHVAGDPQVVIIEVEP